MHLSAARLRWSPSSGISAAFVSLWAELTWKDADVGLVWVEVLLSFGLSELPFVEVSLTVPEPFYGSMKWVSGCKGNSTDLKGETIPIPTKP